jgi:hypothetical protein
VNAVLDFYNANLAVRNLDSRYGTTTMERLIHEAMIRKACTLLGAFDSKAAHSGAVSLLIWSAMRIAMKRELSLDFDGGSTAGILKFLGGFGGPASPRPWQVMVQTRSSHCVWPSTRRD